MATSAIRNRILGCLYGQAIGDALGTRYEFKNAPVTASIIAKDTRSDGFLPILGGGPFDNAPGQVTDDTEMAMGLARSMIRFGTFNPEDVANSYYNWFLSNPFDIGNTTRAALYVGAIAEKGKIREKIVENSLKQNKASLSNGCLMRISPLAIAGHSWKIETLQKAARLDTELTNPNQVTLEATGAYVTAIRTAILTGNAEESFQAAESFCKLQTLKDLFSCARKQAIPVKLDGQDVWVQGDAKAMGYFGVALQVALYHLLHSHNFHDALRDTVAIGGDTDTNGCIAGALLGAVLGADAIPEEWKSTVVEAKPKRLEKYPVVELSDLEEVALKLAECREPEL